MVAELLETVRTLTIENRIFLGASIAVAILVVLSVLFSLYTIWLRLRNSLRASLWAERELKWSNSTLEALSGERSIEELAAQVGANDGLPFLDFLLRYARRLRGGERDRVRELARPFLALLEPLLTDRDPYVRAGAVQTLGTLGTEDYGERIANAVEDESPFVAMLAARSLALYGGARYTTPVVANLDRFENWSPVYVTSLLVSLGPDAALELRQVMEDLARPPKVRALAAHALRELHDIGSAPSAVRALGSDPSADLATAVLRLLAVVGGESEIDDIRAFLDHEHFAVRAEAYTSLSVLGGDVGESYLEVGLDDPSPWVVLRAARGMRERGQQARLREIVRTDRPGAGAAGQVLAEA